MRYILDDNGYVKYCSNTQMTCENKSCTEYKGKVPSGYTTIEEWATKANIRAYKIVSGNLTYDSTKDTNLKKEYEELAKTYSTVEKKIGTWIDGKPLYRKVISTTQSVPSGTTKIAHGISNVNKIFVENAYIFHATNGYSYRLPSIGYDGNFTDHDYVWLDRTNINIVSNGSWGTAWEKVIILNYTKTTD
jgi:hypothetical protein